MSISSVINDIVLIALGVLVLLIVGLVGLDAVHSDVKSSECRSRNGVYLDGMCFKKEAFND